MPFSPTRLVRIKKYGSHCAGTALKKQTLSYIAVYAVNTDTDTEVCLCVNAYIHTRIPISRSSDH